MYFYFLVGYFISQYVKNIFQTSRYQGIVKATVSGVNEDLKFKLSEGSGQLQFWSEPSEILNLRSSNNPEPVASTIP